MDVSDLRRRILRALEDAQKDVSYRRKATDEAAKAYETFLSAVAVPVMKQAALVMNAAHFPVVVHTPASGARLASEGAPETFVEIVLDSTSPAPHVVGRVSLTRGRQGIVVEERPIAANKAIADLTEEDVSAFLVSELPKLVVRP